MPFLGCPPEIIDLIVSFTDSTDWAPLSLTCTSFRPPTQQRIFSDVTVGDSGPPGDGNTVPPALASFLSLIDSNPTLVTHVRALAIRQYTLDWFVCFPKIAIRVLLAFSQSRICTLRLAEDGYLWFPHISDEIIGRIEDITRKPSFSKLVLDGISGLPINLLRRWSHVQSLSIIRCSLRESESGSTDAGDGNMDHSSIRSLSFSWNPKATIIAICHSRYKPILMKISSLVLVLTDDTSTTMAILPQLPCLISLRIYYRFDPTIFSDTLIGPLDNLPLLRELSLNFDSVHFASFESIVSCIQSINTTSIKFVSLTFGSLFLLATHFRQVTGALLDLRKQSKGLIQIELLARRQPKESMSVLEGLIKGISWEFRIGIADPRGEEL